MDTNDSESIENIKCWIYLKEEIPIQKQRIIFAG